VKKLGERDGYIDLLWKGMILVEMKSKGKNLDRAYEQAKDYLHGLKEHELPKYILVSDFEHFTLTDLEENKKISFKIIGHAHNQREFFFKKKQVCDIIIVSPIFYNDKYSRNQILDILKFNLLTKDWSNSICALGGINLSNITKIKLTKSKYIGVKKFIENLK
jgi:hypothetical protein